MNTRLASPVASALAALAFGLASKDASALSCPSSSTYCTGFEGTPLNNSAWFFTGNANIDYNKGLAYDGLNEGWVNAYTGWNAINITTTLGPGPECAYSAFIRASTSLTGGYFAVWDAENRGVNVLNRQLAAGDGATYIPYNGTFGVPPSGIGLLDFGLWGNGADSWIQVDDVVISCPETIGFNINQVDPCGNSVGGTINVSANGNWFVSGGEFTFSGANIGGTDFAMTCSIGAGVTFSTSASVGGNLFGSSHASITGSGNSSAVALDWNAILNGWQINHSSASCSLDVSACSAHSNPTNVPPCPPSGPSCMCTESVCN